MNEILVLNANKNVVQNYGQDLLKLAQSENKKTFNNTQLAVFGDTSTAIQELLDYIDHYNAKEKKWLDTIPFFGKALKDNRYKTYTIDAVVSDFHKRITDYSSNINACLDYSHSVRKEIASAKSKIEGELASLSKLLQDTVNVDYSRYNTLEAKHKNQELYGEGITDEEFEELYLIKNNLEILNGTKKALELAVQSLDMKKKLFTTIIESGTRIQGKAKQCQVLPMILEATLDTIRISSNLASSANCLANTEAIVKTLVSGASSSVNNLVDQTNQIKDLSMDFNNILNSIREVKTDCDHILNGVNLGALPEKN
jgi:archaellum component FlaC